MVVRWTYGKDCPTPRCPLKGTQGILTLGAVCSNCPRRDGCGSERRDEGDVPVPIYSAYVPTSVLGTGQSELFEPQVAQKVGGFTQLMTPATCPRLTLQKHRLRLVATDGAFSMDGDIAPLQEICGLASRYDALVFVDECHATGFLGATGRWEHVAPEGWAPEGGRETRRPASSSPVMAEGSGGQWGQWQLSLQGHG